MGMNFLYEVLPLSIGIFVTLWLVNLFHTIIRPDLRGVPGPFFRSVSNIPRLLSARSGHYHVSQLALHRKYGDIVRLGPNCISVFDPTLIQDIYGSGSGFNKSGFYPTQQNYSNGKAVQGMFNTLDQSLHRKLRKPVAHVYSMTKVKDFEPLVDRTNEVFFQQLDKRFARTGEIFNLGLWLQFYSFDVVGEVTFSRRLGFLDSGEDVENIIPAIKKKMIYSGWVGQMPWIDKVLEKNRIVSYFGYTSPVVKFAARRRAERLASSDFKDYDSKDFLSQFLEIQARSSDIPDWYVTTWTLTNVFAGSDTTAIALKAIVYYLLKNPRVLKLLREELRDHNISFPINWSVAKNLPYLDAVVKEAMRLHPSVSFPLERVVPDRGVKILGKTVKEGTIIGVNPWVIHRNKVVFGPDAEEFRPERWLEATIDELKSMDRSYMTVSQHPNVLLN